MPRLARRSAGLVGEEPSRHGALPSAPSLRVIEDKRLPRTRGWNALRAAADVRGIHADDDVAMQGLVLPENSHLSRACSAVFTDAYVRRLATLTDRLVLRAAAPAPLAAADCAVRQPPASPLSVE